MSASYILENYNFFSSGKGLKPLSIASHTVSSYLCGRKLVIESRNFHHSFTSRLYRQSSNLHSNKKEKHDSLWHGPKNPLVGSSFLVKTWVGQVEHSSLLAVGRVQNGRRTSKNSEIIWTLVYGTY